MYYTEEFVAYKFTYLLLIVFKSIMLKCNPVIIQTWWLVRHSEKSNVSDICLISVRNFFNTADKSIITEINSINGIYL